MKQIVRVLFVITILLYRSILCEKNNKEELRYKVYPCGKRICPEGDPICACRNLANGKEEHRTLLTLCDMYAVNDCGAAWRYEYKGFCNVPCEKSVNHWKKDNFSL